jgi:ATP-dependent DNA helicase RecG
MIELCHEAGLPEPQFEQRSGSFVLTLWRDWLTESVLAEYGLSDRQHAVVLHMKVSERITTSEYRNITGVSESTALRELRQMVQTGILVRVGALQDEGRSTLLLDGNPSETRQTLQVMG